MRSVALLGLLVAGCSSCNGSGPVPFGLDASPRAATGPTADPDEPSVDRRGEARALPDGTASADVDGASLAVDTSIRALYALDVDGDGDRDAVALVSEPPRLLFYRRDGDRFGEPRELGRVPSAEGCAIGEASFAPLGERWLHGQVDLRCEASPTDERTDHFVLDEDRTPRVLERVAVLSPIGRAEGDIRLTLDLDDRDEDGHDDLVIGVRLGREEGTADLSLSWLDRPSGLARQANEPEATLVERSRDALRRLRASPREALDRSLQVLALHRALCREPGVARLVVGTVTGLPCGESDGAGRAATTVVRARAALGDTAAALDDLAALDDPGLRIDDERRDYARRALASAPATGGVTMRAGPTARVPTASGTRLSALGFLDEGRVLIRSEPPSIWDLTSGEATPADDGERRVLDPSGRFHVGAIERTCEGHVLALVANGLPAGNALIVEREPPPGATCPLDGRAREDDGGWSALGWAPQGVLVARQGELRIVPLDVGARPAGPPRVIDARTPPPAPLPAGAISSDGRHLIELHGPGVSVRRVTPRGDAELLWPEGWGELEGEPTDAAVSSSGRRVAVLRGGRVYLIERGASPSP